MQEYFDEAKKWYYMKYIQNIRFILIVVFIFFVVICVTFFTLKKTIDAKNNQERVSKVISTNYDVTMMPGIEKIGKYYRSNDINILLYTVRTFVENFESYPKVENQYTAFVQKNQNLQKYCSTNVLQVLNNRFNKEYSKKMESNGFVKVIIQNIDFLLKEKPFLQKMRDYLMPETIPTKARIDFIVYVFDGTKLIKKNESVELNFTFSPIKKQNGQYNNIRFFVNEYRYIN